VSSCGDWDPLPAILFHSHDYWTSYLVDVELVLVPEVVVVVDELEVEEVLVPLVVVLEVVELVELEVDVPEVVVDVVLEVVEDVLVPLVVVEVVLEVVELFLPKRQFRHERRVLFPPRHAHKSYYHPLHKEDPHHGGREYELPSCLWS